MRPLGSSSKERSWLGVPFPYVPWDDLVIWYSCILSSWTQWLQGLQGFWGIKLFSSRNCTLFQKGLSSLYRIQKVESALRRTSLLPVLALCSVSYFWQSTCCSYSQHHFSSLRCYCLLLVVTLLVSKLHFSSLLIFFLNPFYFVLNFPTSSFSIATDKRWVLLSFW